MAYLSSTPGASTWSIIPVKNASVRIMHDLTTSPIVVNENNTATIVSINRLQTYDFQINTEVFNVLIESHLNENEVPLEVSFTLRHFQQDMYTYALGGKDQLKQSYPTIYWLSNESTVNALNASDVNKVYHTPFYMSTIRMKHIVYPSENFYFGTTMLGPPGFGKAIITDVHVKRPEPSPFFFPERILRANEKLIEYNDARAENWAAPEQINGRINNAQINTINFLIDPATNADLLAINENYVTYSSLSATTLTSYIQYLSDVKNTTNFVNDGFGNAYNFFNENSTVYFNLANDFNANLSNNMNEINLLSATIANIEVSNIADTNFAITNSDIINLQVSINDELLTTICDVSNAITVKELLNINSLNSLMSNTNNSIISTGGNIVIVNDFASNVITIGASANTQVDETAILLNSRRVVQNTLNDIIYFYYSNLGSFPNTVKYGLPHLISTVYNTFNIQSTNKTENVDEVYTIVNDLVNAVNENKNIANTLPAFVKNNINDIITSIGSTDQRIAETIYHFNRFI